eukprot:CAMPEP_0172418860 /NCGR_PEP_ID=MMETSP1064-20121228/5307_1 /TAXON_ID=202472 /ORGANISM="Aulacoseira subarctica , Strain CCAP 1002/5" /LENGTH=40 /DNA_ID= /DNA_START= /DNA_END= /DNA_ORIENTATION=
MSCPSFSSSQQSTTASSSDNEDFSFSQLDIFQQGASQPLW